MILLFPDLETIRLAISSAIVPADVASSPVEVRFDEAPGLLVRSKARLAKSALNELKKLGVEDRSRELARFESFESWLQLFPVDRDRSATVPPASAPVFFELPESQVAGFVGEMLRLGVDRQSFRWLEQGGGPVALLRVVGPPYFSLLRAIDRVAGSVGPVAYVEQSPRVLVEFGHRHPFADRIVPPSGSIVLIREPRDWRFAQEGAFRDVYGSLEFALPKPGRELRAVELSRRYPISLQLTRGSANDAAEFWALRGNAEEQIEALVGSSDDQLLARLAFAVGEAPEDGPPTVVLRVRPSKLPPPALVLDGVGFRPYLRLPNLFLPVGQRLHPPLRRDAVAKLLAVDPERIHWLTPEEGGGFIPESLPDSAFRPLGQWVDYVLDREHRPLQSWVESTRFDFEPFACDDDDGDGTKPDRKGRRKKKIAGSRDLPSGTDRPIDSPPSILAAPPEPRAEPGPTQKIEPDAALVRLAKLEARYRSLNLPPGSADWVDLLHEMAGLNMVADRPTDASACWALAAWESASPPESMISGWAEAANRDRSSSLQDPKGMKRLLEQKTPTSADLRALATTLIRQAFATQGSPTDGPIACLDQIQPFLIRHESSLPTRMAWLAWVSIHRLNRGDVLTLARARDRVLERLHLAGLRPDLDLPGFLRFGAGVSADRSRMIREHLVRFREFSLDWVDRGHMVAPHTRVLADLIFAYGMARLGDQGLATQYLESSRASTRNRDAVMLLLGRAFEHRIRQAIDGQASIGPLPPDLMQRLDLMGKQGSEDDQKKEKEQRYKVDRLRSTSRILEPLERLNAYRHWNTSNSADLALELAEWPDIADRDELSRRVSRGLATKSSGPDAAIVQSRIVKEALEVSFRLGEEQAIQVLQFVLPVGERTGDLARQAELLEKGLRVAAHFDRTEQVRAFVARFDVLLASGGPKAAATLEPLIGQCFRGLRKLGLREEIEQLLRRLSEVVLDGRDLSIAGPRVGPAAIEWSKGLKPMLQVASVWFDFGDGEKATPILDEVRGLLREGNLIPVEQTSLACAYLRAMALAPAEVALPRMAEFFLWLDRVHDSFTTTSHYSLSRLNVIEAAVTTLVSDEFAIDRSSRGQLEDDEFLVRRRIHRDVREAMEAGS